MIPPWLQSAITKRKERNRRQWAQEREYLKKVRRRSRTELVLALGGSC